MSEQMRILEMIESGEVTPEEGEKLLRELENESSAGEIKIMDLLEKIEQGELSPDDGIEQLKHQREIETRAVETQGEETRSSEGHPPPSIPEAEIERWKTWWTYPLYIGVGIVIIAAIWMNSSYQDAGYSFWFFCAWVPLALGILLISLSWLSQKGPWIHVRVKGKDNVAISMPAPLGLAGWGLRTFGHLIPNLDRTSVDEIISALELSIKSDEPIYVLVDDDEGDEHVEVFIG